MGRLCGYGGNLNSCLAGGLEIANIDYKWQVKAALQPARAEAARICGEVVRLEVVVTSGPNITAIVDVGITRSYRQVSTLGDGKENLAELKEGIIQAGRDYAAGLPGEEAGGKT